MLESIVTNTVHLFSATEEPISYLRHIGFTDALGVLGGFASGYSLLEKKWAWPGLFASLGLAILPDAYIAYQSGSFEWNFMSTLPHTLLDSILVTASFYGASLYESYHSQNGKHPLPSLIDRLHHSPLFQHIRSLPEQVQALSKKLQHTSSSLWKGWGIVGGGAGAVIASTYISQLLGASRPVPESFAGHFADYLGAVTALGMTLRNGFTWGKLLLGSMIAIAPDFLYYGSYTGMNEDGYTTSHFLSDALSDALLVGGAALAGCGQRFFRREQSPSLEETSL